MLTRVQNLNVYNGGTANVHPREISINPTHIVAAVEVQTDTQRCVKVMLTDGMDYVISQDDYGRLLQAFADMVRVQRGENGKPEQLRGCDVCWYPIMDDMHRKGLCRCDCHVAK